MTRIAKIAGTALRKAAGKTSERQDAIMFEALDKIGKIRSRSIYSKFNYVKN